MSAEPALRQRNAIHPDDVEAQRAVSARLTELRRERFTAVEFAARLGITHNNLWGFEHGNRVNMSLLLVERRAGPVGLRLALDVVGMPEEVEEDLAVIIMDGATVPLEPAARAERLAYLTGTRLSVARCLLNVSERELAARMGITQATVNGLLRDVSRKTRIASFQRVARALGGTVTPRLMEA